MSDFQPGSVKFLEVRNKYRSLQIREVLWGAEGRELDFGFGTELRYEVRYQEGEFPAFESAGGHLRQLDLNNGKSADDINFPQPGNSGDDSITYVAGSGRRGTLVELTAGTVGAVLDLDGIAGGAPGQVVASIEDETLVITLSLK
ncbi:hypothetical protein ABZ319_27655 [Nocardia sp. NPDC005978]|uniref:hypothetical protein n=1 Tax=Nocardia sp. NPDC005978 TaxID=3156725 RepID=UPI0033A46238